MVYLVCNDANAEKAKESMIGDRVPCIEHAFQGKQSTINKLKDNKQQRLMFTHLRTSFFEQEIKQSNIKVILLIRNAGDTLISYYHFYKLATRYSGDWNSFFEIFQKKQLVYGDYYDWYVDWLRLLHFPNVILMRYEDIKRYHAASVEMLSRFLGKTLSSNEIQIIVEATSFTAMKRNPGTNQKQNPMFDHQQGEFIRKGEVGDWKNYFNEEQTIYIKHLDEEFLKPFELE